MCRGVQQYRYFKLGRPRFAVHPHCVRLMTGFGFVPNSAAFTSSIISTAVLQQLQRTTCVSQHPQTLKTGGFCWSKDLLPACPC